MQELTSQKLLASAHDISEGGLAVTLLESAFPNQLGFTVQMEALEPNWIYSETQSCVVVSVSPENEDAFNKVVSGQYCLHKLGVVTDDSNVSLSAKTPVLENEPVDGFYKAWSEGFENAVFPKKDLEF